MGWGGPGYGGDYPDLTEEQRQAVEQERRAFIKDTDDLRQNLYTKELALRSELAKSDADAQKAAVIQKDISKLEAELDQKRLDHIVKMKEVNPEAGRGFMMGGRGRGGIMGYGTDQVPAVVLEADTAGIDTDRNSGAVFGAVS